MSSRALEHARWEMAAGLPSPPVVIGGDLVLPLPLLQVSGTFAPVVPLSGSLVLPSAIPSVSGTFAPVVEIVGSLVLPQLRIAGTIDPVVAPLAGSLVLPQFQLAGTIAPVVSLVGSLVLPQFQLAGTFTVAASKVSGWYRLGSSSQSGGKWSSIVDLQNAGSPIVQTVAGRRTSVGVTPNGLPTMVFGQVNNVHLMPASPALVATTKIGVFLWLKMTPAGCLSGGAFFAQIAGNFGSTTFRFFLTVNNGTLASTNFGVQFMITNANGRFFNGPSGGVTPGTWYPAYLQYDSSRGGDANAALFVNGLTQALAGFNSGAGGTLTTLQVANGSIGIGGQSDVDTPYGGFGAGVQIGPNIFAFTDNLTAAEQVAIRAYESPVPVISSLIAMWSANEATAPLSYNRISTTTIGALIQSTLADQPWIYSLPNGVKVFRFDGATQDLFVASAITAFRFTGPRGYWAFHVRMPAVPAGSRTLWAEWAAGGSTERIQILSTSATVIAVQVAISAVAFASSPFTVSLAEQQAGMWLEVLYDGGQAVADDRVKLWVNGLEVAHGAVTGTIPVALLAGDASSAWFGSLNGSSNKQVDLAHMYIANDHPTFQERAMLRAWEAPQWLDTTTIGGVDVTALSQLFRGSDGVVRGSGVAFLPDRLGLGGAVTIYEGYSPLVATASNGVQFLTMFDDLLSLPPSAANNNLTTWGFGLHLALDRGVTPGNVLRMGATTGNLTAAGSSLCLAVNSNGDVQVDVHVDSTGANRRKAISATGVVLTTWVYMTVEFEGGAAGESDQLIITVDGTILVLTFSAGAGVAAAMPAALQGAGALNLALFSLSIGGINTNFIGRANNLAFFSSKMAGATRGLLTAAARTALAAANRPSDSPGYAASIVSRTAQVFDVASTSVVVTLPTRAIGDRLILCLTRSSASSDAIQPPEGWTPIDAGGLTGTTDAFSRAYRYDCTAANVGDPSNATFTGGSSVLSVSVVWRIANSDLARLPRMYGQSQAASTTNDPPSFSPFDGNSRSYLFLAYIGTGGQDSASGATPAVTVFPTGYSNTATQTTHDAVIATGCGQGYADKAATVTSENPSAWTICPTNAATSQALTIVLWAA